MAESNQLETRKPHRSISADQDLDFDAIQISVATPEEILEC